ncbi:HTH domain-containing protein [Natronobeatus ordinarius]|uniref:HTH domain-containing protein n=1 Tax=Natronobeatus ordinarius TaxID=2963433 RepID=UPI0020CFC87A|nr:HTH domain-containing protein [Natronobeatus ordinarius]
MASKTAELTAVCYVRAPLLLEPVDQQVETLQACEADGTVDTVLLRSWPKEVARTENSPYQEVLEAFERFDRWADERGVSVQPPFRERTVTSTVTGESKDVLVTPMLCLAVYRNDELHAVFPHTDGEETVTASEAIATLRTGELPTPLGAPPTEPERANACPECDGDLLNGQGVFACLDCGFTASLTADGRYVELELSTPEAPEFDVAPDLR